MARVTDVANAVSLPEELTRYAEEQPNSPVYRYGGDSVITAEALQRAGRRAAQRIQSGSAPESVVGIVASYDLLVYETTLLGLMCAGLVPFPISPRLTPSTILHLLRSVDAHRLIISKSSLPLLEEQVLSELRRSVPEYHVEIEDIPSLAFLYPTPGQESDEILSQSFMPYKHPLSSTAIILHSSGSTGLPKAIRQTYRFLACVAYCSIPRETQMLVDGSVRLAGMHALPFHALGNHMLMLAPIYNRWSVSLFPPRDGPVPSITPDSLLSEMILNRCNVLMIVPLFLQAWAAQPKALEYLRQLRVVMYGGGPLPSDVGDSLVQAGARLRCMYAGTEFATPTRLIPREASAMDWGWLEFHDDVRVRWVEENRSLGLYECVILQSDAWELAKENLAGGERGYATNDLFERHPTKSGMWRIVGRKDDVLVHTNGLKTVPSPIEHAIKAHPFLKGALMFGHQRDRPGVLIDPLPEYIIDITDEKAVASIRNTIWPVVSQANDSAPAYSKVYKEMILVASAGKRPEYTAKNLIFRSAALILYRDEIDALYERVDVAAKGTDIESPVDWSQSEVRQWLVAQATELVKGATSFDVGADLFQQGLDSLGATMLRLRVLAALKAADHPAAALLDEDSVYSHPSIEGLATFILGEETDMQTSMEDVIKKYNVGFPGRTLERREGSRSDKFVVLLTGTTGNLGSEILLTLLHDPNVDKIFAFNRPADDHTATERQYRRFEDKGFDLNLLQDPRLNFIEGEAFRDRIGLSESDYDLLRKSITTIIHTAWTLDFNLSLSSYEVHIQGMRNLIDLACEGDCPSGVKFIFTSSVAVAQSWPDSLGRYPENTQADINTARGMGYGESKYVAEALLAKSGLQATSLRIGQISGSEPRGAWATTDWVPVMLKTSLTLGMLPNGPGFVHWIPMHTVSAVMWDIARHEGDLPCSVNVVNHHAVSWTNMMNYLRTVLVEQGQPKLALVPWKTWIAQLKLVDSVGNRKELPASRMPSFFRVSNDITAQLEPGRFDTSLCRQLSKTLDDAPSVDHEDARRWVLYWLKEF